MGIDLAGAAEDDTVLVDDVDLAGGVDAAKDLAGGSAGVGDLVERDPGAYVGAACALIEVHGGVLAHVERFPVQHGLLAGLGDVDGVAALGGLVGSGPKGGVGGYVRMDFQSSGADAIGHVGELEGGRVGIGSKVVGATLGSGPCGGLHVLHGLQGLGRAS